MTTSPSTTDRIDAYVWKISLIVVVGSMMSILDTTIVNVALQTLSNRLHSSISSIQWIVTGYMLSLAAVIPVTGWAARRFGGKRIYLTSLVLFVLGSALCGLATSSTELIVFRVLQGIGGGMILPIGQLIMADAAGPQRMGRVMSLISVPVMLAPILGPTVGGLILQSASWRWIFYVNVPIGVVAVVLAWRMLPAVRLGAAGKLDVAGLLLMASGLPLVTYGLAEVGITGGFSAPKVWLPILVGLILVAVFIRHALHSDRPLLNVRLHRRPTFSSAAFAMFCLGAALFGSMILLPLYWQGIRHYSVIDTGLLTAPQGLGAAMMMPLAGKLTDRLGGGPIALVGVTICALATIPFALIGATTSVFWLCMAMFVRGMGIGLAFMPAMAAAFASLNRDELSDATPQLNVLQRFGGSIGTAAMAVVLERATLSNPHTLQGGASAFGTAFWWSTGITAAAFIPCLILLNAERRARASRAEIVRFQSEEMAEAVAA